MSKYAFNTAIKYGKKLCAFNNLSEAEDYFISRKDFLLNKLKAVSTQTSAFVPDNTVESLKKIEKWYFDLYEAKAFDRFGLSREEFEQIMSFYWGEVVVKKNEDAKWVVEEYPFVKGKYELLVNKGLFGMAIGNPFRDLYKRQNNKRRNLLFREYNKYFGR